MLHGDSQDLRLVTSVCCGVATNIDKLEGSMMMSVEQDDLINTDKHHAWVRAYALKRSRNSLRFWFIFVYYYTS